MAMSPVNAHVRNRDTALRSVTSNHFPRKIEVVSRLLILTEYCGVQHMKRAKNDKFSNGNSYSCMVKSIFDEYYDVIM